MYQTEILNCDINKSVKQLTLKIRHCVNNKIPFALARYGDGEAKILKQKNNKPLTNETINVFKKTLGYNNLNQNILLNLKNWIESIKDMDVNSFQTKIWLDNISKFFYDELYKYKIIKNSINVPIKVTNILFYKI